MFWMNADIKQLSIKNVAIGVFLLILAGYGYFGGGSHLLPFLNDGENLLAVALVGVGSLVYGVKDYFFYNPEDNEEDNSEKK